jgi:hypothetical protein
MAELYKHIHLSGNRSIRVLTLEPSPDKVSQPRFSLTEIDLDDNPNFEALSYVWGSVEPASFVICDKKQLKITQNCYAALRYLRWTEKPRTLWVDAICIDQASIQEKNQQVPLMTEIYGKAKRVLVWLAPEYGNTLAVSKHFARIALLARLRLVRIFIEDMPKIRFFFRSAGIGTVCEQILLKKSKKLGGTEII